MVTTYSAIAAYNYLHLAKPGLSLHHSSVPGYRFTNQIFAGVFLNYAMPMFTASTDITLKQQILVFWPGLALPFSEKRAYNSKHKKMQHELQLTERKHFLSNFM